MSEKIDPLTPLGRRVLNEVKAKLGEPGWVAPGGEHKLADPVELGWVALDGAVELDGGDFPEAA